MTRDLASMRSLPRFDPMIPRSCQNTLITSRTQRLLSFARVYRLIYGSGGYETLIGAKRSEIINEIMMRPVSSIAGKSPTGVTT